LGEGVDTELYGAVPSGRREAARRDGQRQSQGRGPGRRWGLLCPEELHPAPELGAGASEVLLPPPEVETSMAASRSRCRGLAWGKAPTPARAGEGAR
jgi:hypothetical protein